MAKASRNRKRDAYSEEERLAHYDYLLRVLPGSIVGKAHAEVFASLPPGMRVELADASGPSEQAGLQDALVRRGIRDVVATRFVRTVAVAWYFESGAGSVMIDDQPPWIADLVHHDGAPIDAGRINHRKGADSGMWF